MKHYPVRWDGREFQFGFGRFTSVDELREHFASRPVIGGESGTHTTFIHVHVAIRTYVYMYIHTYAVCIIVHCLLRACICMHDIYKQE